MHTTRLALAHERSVQCLCEPSPVSQPALFFYYSLDNGRGIFHSDRCVSSTHGWPPDLYFNCSDQNSCQTPPKTKMQPILPREILVESCWKQIWLLCVRRWQVPSKCSVIANLENAQNCRDSHSIDRNQLD